MTSKSSWKNMYDEQNEQEKYVWRAKRAGEIYMTSKTSRIIRYDKQNEQEKYV